MKLSLVSRTLLVSAVSMILAASASNAAEADDALVKRVHASAITIDAHIDILDDFDARRAAKETTEQFDLPKLERGDLDVATVALFANPAATTPENVIAARREVSKKLEGLRQLVATHGDRLEFARSAADIERISKAGKHGILLSFLNALPVGDDLSLLSKYQQDGVRVFGFVHASNNAFADSSRPNAAFGDKPNEHGGLTDLGKRAVAELNRLGVVIDVSQLTPAGVLQTVQLSSAPVIASHSGLRSRVDVPRNLSDEELKAIAARGGVVHIVAFASYLKSDPKRREEYQRTIWDAFGLKQGVDDPKQKLDAATYAKYQAAYRKFSADSWRYASVADYVDSIDAAVKVIGVDHVGLSSDFNHGGGVTGFANVGEAQGVTRELLRRGYTEAQVKQLWGGNFLRVLKQAEAQSRS